MTYQTTMAQQRNFDSFAFFSALYLVVSDILLTHTHTHTHNAPGVTNTFFLFAYARAKRAVTLVNKGLFGVSFVRFFMPFYDLDLEQNKNEITNILININRMR